MMLGAEHTEGPSGSGRTAQGPQSPLARLAAMLLHKRMKIRVQDGRVLVGDFVCMDKQGNIVLHQTVEELIVDGRPQEKVLGQVLIPAQHRVTCEVEAMPQDKASLEQLVALGLQPVL